MRVLDLARPETVHEYRSIFHRARSIKNSQDAFCSKLSTAHTRLGNTGKAAGLLKASGVDAAGVFPGDEDSNWDVETVVGLLRGDVKAMTHCYTTLDFNSFIRVSDIHPSAVLRLLPI